LVPVQICSIYFRGLNSTVLIDIGHIFNLLAGLRNRKI
jgi:hypothetical protein